jgi:hypothetical protein
MGLPERIMSTFEDQLASFDCKIRGLTQTVKAFHTEAIRLKGTLPVYDAHAQTKFAGVWNEIYDVRAPVMYMYDDTSSDTA